MNSFNDFQLPKFLQKAIDELGITTPTPIQEKAFSPILSGRDVMGIAQTGTGKTLAYLLPILKQYQFSKSDNPSVLIVVPTRELVVQVTEVVKKLTAYMSVRTAGIYGGVNINTQKLNIGNGVDIVVGTPGRLMDLALDGVLRLDEVKKLVIDEFDEMLNLGFRFQITSILSMMKDKRQNILFSATMTDEVDDMLNDYFDFPEEITLAPSGTPLENIEQFKYLVPNFNTKINLLIDLLESDLIDSRLLIFVNDKRNADLLHEKIEELYPEQFGVIHSNKSQNYRLNTLKDFQEENIKGIITTDIMARGLDISNVSHVINFEIADVPEKYMHRIGRTGRADKTGVAISLISPSEVEPKIEVELLMNTEIKELPIPEDLKIEERYLDFEKEKKKMKFLLKTPKKEGGEAFHKKKEKNTKVNLGGPGKRTPRKTESRNRAVERKRAEKKKKR